jgi:hypothetical protein
MQEEEMIKNLIAGVSAAALVTTGVIAQTQSPATQSQTPQSPATQSPTTPRAPDTTATAQQGADVTLTGCLYRERDIPGRAPNVAERVGIAEDYILTEARPAGSSAQGLATGRMYKVEHVNDEQLGALVGRRVEVMGRIDAEASDVTPGGAPAADRNPISPDKIDLPEFEARSIRQADGTCPAVPVTAPAAPTQAPVR